MRMFVEYITAACSGLTNTTASAHSGHRVRQLTLLRIIVISSVSTVISVRLILFTEPPRTRQGAS